MIFHLVQALDGLALRWRIRCQRVGLKVHCCQRRYAEQSARSYASSWIADRRALARDGRGKRQRGAMLRAGLQTRECLHEREGESSLALGLRIRASRSRGRQWRSAVKLTMKPGIRASGKRSGTCFAPVCRPSSACARRQENLVWRCNPAKPDWVGWKLQEARSQSGNWQEAEDRRHEAEAE